MRRYLLCLTAILFFIAPAFAKLRPPTAVEQQVLQKYESAINKILDQFQSDDWDENVDYSVSEDVTVAPDAGCPLDVDEMFQRTYRARNNSERWNRLIGPQMAKLQEEADPAKKMAIGQSFQALMAVEVEVHFNVTNLTDTPPPGGKSLQIPGAALSVPATSNPYTHGAAYVLAFGNWKDAKWDGANGWYHFHFAHPQNSPFIENVVFKIYGADDRIQQLLKSIDWNAVNEGMTR